MGRYLPRHPIEPSYCVYVPLFLGICAISIDSTAPSRNSYNGSTMEAEAVAEESERKKGPSIPTSKPAIIGYRFRRILCQWLWNHWDPWASGTVLFPGTGGLLNLCPTLSFFCRRLLWPCSMAGNTAAILGSSDTNIFGRFSDY